MWADRTCRARGSTAAKSLAVAILIAAPSRCAEGGVDYSAEVKPLLRERCYACHGALKQEAGLRLDSGEAIRRGGDSGAAVASGDADASLLIARVSDPDPATRMPPEGRPLSAEEVETLRAWVGDGAASPPDEAPEADPREHWAFRRPVRPTVPVVGPAGANPVDAFLAAEQIGQGVSPLPRAEPQVLLRRVYLDLVGLPPSRRELHAFLADPSDEAYERAVDRLLADPRHGERWGRHWMDVWRYSDWYGRRGVPDVLNSYGMIWRWRDWIVAGVNGNRPYDEMVRLMLAADELEPADEADLVATGYLVRNFFRWNYDSWKKDNVEHVGKAFLGLTFNCAHCHDHKYDPITHEDYFRLRAVFEPIELRHDRIPGEPDPGPYPKYDYGKAYPPIASGMVRVTDERLDAETYLYTRGEARNVVPGRPPVPPGVPAFLDDGSFRAEPLDLPAEVHHPGLKGWVREEEAAARRGAVAAAERAVEEAKASAGEGASDSAPAAVGIAEATLTAARAELASYEARVEAELVRFGGKPGDAEATAKVASRAEREAAVAKATAEFARAERAAAEAHERATADANSQAAASAAEAQVAAARTALDAARVALEQDSSTYTPVGPEYPARSTGRRAGLARWVASPANPLAARVAVNHLWRWHFGGPIVATTADFGRNGALPTHPELLDWLAVEFTESGWDMKRMHRLLVTSEAYKRRSHASAGELPGRSADPENRTYWRFEPARMEAEVVRDSLLAVSGALDEPIGGADIDQSQGATSRRRSLYFTHHGETRMTFLDLFDAADPCDCYRRTVSVVPQQALALTNNDLSVELSGRLEGELSAEADSRDDEAFVTAAFEAVLSRVPTGEERDLVLEFLARPADASGEEEPVGSDEERRARARRGLIRALFNHNDFVTIR